MGWMMNPACGMVCAFFHPRYEAALKWIDERPGPARVAIQSAILATTLAVTVWQGERAWFSLTFSAATDHHTLSQAQATHTENDASRRSRVHVVHIDTLIVRARFVPLS